MMREGLEGSIGRGGGEMAGWEERRRGGGYKSDFSKCGGVED